MSRALPTREQVVREARTWLSTPFHMNAAVKGVGVDCGRFVQAVYEACGLVRHFAAGDFPGDWCLHADEERYVTLALEHLIEVPSAEPGDMVLFKWGRVFGHAGLAVSWPCILHVCRVGSRVEYADATQEPQLKRRETRFFSPFRTLPTGLPTKAA